MSNNFDLKQFLVENKLTTNSKMLGEEGADNVEQKLQQLLAQSADAMQNKAQTVKPSPKDSEVQEAIGFTIAALVASAPGLLNILGKTANGIADVMTYGKDSAVFKKDTWKKGGAKNLLQTKEGSKLIDAGHKLEHKYIDSLGGWLKAAFPKKYEGQDVHDNTTELYDHAHGIYASLLVAGAAYAGYEVGSAVSLITKGLEAGSIAVKGVEIADLARKIASA